MKDAGCLSKVIVCQDLQKAEGHVVLGRDTTGSSERIHSSVNTGHHLIKTEVDIIFSRSEFPALLIQFKLFQVF